MNATKPQSTISSREALPALLSAKHIQACGLSRSMAYQLLNRSDMPNLQIGERRFMHRDKFLAWLDAQSECGEVSA